MEIETPCPESPGQWPEYPGVTGKAAKAVRRMRSATARLRSLTLDDLSLTLASSGLHAFTLPGSSTEEREGGRTEEKMTCRLTGGSADDVVS